MAPIKILSWNIQSRDGLEGNKLADKQFTKTLNDHDIFCLQECRKEVKIPNYVCYNKLRPNHKGGGVCIGFARYLMGGIQKYDTKSRRDILAITLDSDFFGFRRNVILISCYIPPINSPGMKQTNGDPFDDLLDLLEEVDNKYDVILCGDFNSRTQTTTDVSLCDSIPGIENVDPTTENNTDSELVTINLSRNNKDANKNSYTEGFFDMISQGNLFIVNGRTLGDIFGDYTCINYNGASTVDYFLLSKTIS